VLAAAAKVREAYLALQRTRLVAPVDGYVAKRGVQLGQRVAAGSPLMTVVDLHQLWVDANFKESQLADLRMGQKAELTADVYGDKTVYHGKVVGLGAGTGAAFSLLPAQNATGNWIKVVQRVPVRISLSPEDLAASAARGPVDGGEGDIRDRAARPWPTPRAEPVAQTAVYDAALPRPRSASPASSPAQRACADPARPGGRPLRPRRNKAAQ
jgi:membrane fusion protein (multidrug efflux system)